MADCTLRELKRCPTLTVRPVGHEQNFSHIIINVAEMRTCNFTDMSIARGQADCGWLCTRTAPRSMADFDLSSRLLYDQTILQPHS